jgi:MoxR-like ATPase
MATQNPLEMEGTYPLPEAQLDRFLLKALVPFPSADDIVQIVDRTTGSGARVAHAVADAEMLRSMIELVRQVPVPQAVTRHAAELVVATHPQNERASDLVDRYVRFGASPRGAQALILAAKATALLDGRPNVSIDDVRAKAAAALRHRLVLGYEATADGVDADRIVASVLEKVSVPSAGLRGAP